MDEDTCLYNGREIKERVDALFAMVETPMISFTEGQRMFRRFCQTLKLFKFTFPI